MGGRAQLLADVARRVGIHYADIFGAAAPGYTLSASSSSTLATAAPGPIGIFAWRAKAARRQRRRGRTGTPKRRRPGPPPTTCSPLGRRRRWCLSPCKDEGISLVVTWSRRPCPRRRRTSRTWSLRQGRARRTSSPMRRQGRSPSELRLWRWFFLFGTASAWEFFQDAENR